MRYMIHHAVYSICEGYGLADTVLRDYPLQLSIVVSLDGVHIPPTPAMRLHQYSYTRNEAASISFTSFDY